jgi:S1-C subfamily serine protease
MFTGRNPFAGATVSNLTPADADQLGLDPFTAAVQITDITPNSVAGGVSQLLKGDLILQVNGQKVGTTEELQGLVNRTTGRTWTISIQRGGQVFNARLSV